MITLRSDILREQQIGQRKEKIGKNMKQLLGLVGAYSYLYGTGVGRGGGKLWQPCRVFAYNTQSSSTCMFRNVR